MTAFLFDLGQAVRLLRRKMGFAAAIVLMLAAGIGTAAVMFAVTYEVLLHPLKVPDPQQLVFIGIPSPPEGDALEWWARCPAFESVAEYYSGGVNFFSESWSERASAAVVSADFFRVLRVAPHLGSTIGGSASRVVIISDRLWARAFARDPGVLGRKVMLNGAPFTVIGVAATHFGFPGHTDIWVPRTEQGIPIELGLDEQEGFPFWLRSITVARLRPEVTVEQARSQLKSIYAQVLSLWPMPDADPDLDVQVFSLVELLVRNYRSSLLLLLCAVGILLLITCTNVSGLLVSQLLSRQREIALRFSLGANRRDISRLLGMEIMLLALGGGITGFFAGRLGLELVAQVAPREIRGIQDVVFNEKTLFFVLGTSILASILLTSLTAAVLPLQRGLNTTLQAESPTFTSGHRKRLRSFLVIIEVALAVVLVGGSFLSIQSLSRLTAIEPGFDAQHVLTASVFLPSASYSAQHRIGQFRRETLEEIHNLPGVLKAGIVSQLPLSGAGPGSVYFNIGGEQAGRALLLHIAGEYFSAMGVPILRGRAFRDADSAGGRGVLIIDRVFARRYWGSMDPIGQMILIQGEESPREVVGVVENVRYLRISEAPRLQIYLPYDQRFSRYDALQEHVFVVRTSTDPMAMIGPVRERIIAFDEQLTVFRAKTLEEIVAGSVSLSRFRTILFVGFGIASLLLVIVGVYGNVAYSVGARTREFGIRFALGATPRDVLFLVLRQGIGVALAGIGIGIAGLIALRDLASSVFYGVGTTHPLAISLSAFLLLSCVLLACLRPAIRASKLHPTDVLRYE